MSHAHDLAVALPTPAPSSDADTHGITFRALEGRDDYHACVALQRDVWGIEFSDVVPASILQIASHVGGILLGAFRGDALLGFVFGITGVRDEEVVHWSHMLGVRLEAREMGIGRRLKERQRALLAGRGIVREFWTFDPLQAKNAHLNINRLGVRVLEYVVDMYGSTDSPLHLGVPTDRLIVECVTGASPLKPPAPPRPILDVAHAPVLSAEPRPGDITLGADAPPTILLEIPIEVDRLPAEARATWRMATRAHFHWALGRGYRAIALHRDRAAGRAFYVLNHTASVA
jgi:predicted GNAT superfamily acetyltransferase